MGVLAPPPIGQNDTLSLPIGQMKSKGANKITLPSRYCQSFRDHSRNFFPWINYQTEIEKKQRCLRELNRETVPQKILTNPSNIGMDNSHYGLTLDLDNKNEIPRKEPFKSSKIPKFG